MPKLKTHKATSKRTIVSGKGKLYRRKAGQDHFNSRERGATKISKRKDVAISHSFHRIIRRMTPYN